MKISILSVMPEKNPYFSGFIKSIIDNFAEFNNYEFELLFYVYDSTSNTLPDFQMLEQKLPARFFYGDNIGFGRANNLLASKSQAQYLLFLNPDTKILHLDLNSLLSDLNFYQLVGLRQIIVDKKAFESINELHSEYDYNFRNQFSHIYPSLDIFFQSHRTYLQENCLFIDGAGLIISKENFSKLGGFDQNFFLFMEDADLGLRALASGMKIKINEQNAILHISGGFIAGGSVDKKSFKTTAIRRYHTELNSLQIAFKILPIGLLIPWIAIWLFVNLTLSLILLILKRKSLSKTAWKALLRLIRNHKLVKLSRKEFKSQLQVPIRQILFKLQTKPAFLVNFFENGIPNVVEDKT